MSWKQIPHFEALDWLLGDSGSTMGFLRLFFDGPALDVPTTTTSSSGREVRSTIVSCNATVPTMRIKRNHLTVKKACVSTITVICLCIQLLSRKNPNLRVCVIYISHVPATSWRSAFLQ
jgi:hypothetical protein